MIFHRRKCPRTTAVVQWTPKNQKPVSYIKKSNYREELCLKICTRPEHSEHQWTMANIKKKTKVKITSKEQLRFQSRYEWCDKKKVSEILRSWCIHWWTRYLGCRQLKGILEFYLRFGQSYHASEVDWFVGYKLLLLSTVYDWILKLAKALRQRYRGLPYCSLLPISAGITTI